MKVSELIAVLSQLDPNTEVLLPEPVILDEDGNGPNGDYDFAKVIGAVPAFSYHMELENMTWEISVSLEKRDEYNTPVVVLASGNTEIKTPGRLTDMGEVFYTPFGPMLSIKEGYEDDASYAAKLAQWQKELDADVASIFQPLPSPPSREE